MSEHKNILTPHIGAAALSSPLEVGADRAGRAAEDLAELLERAGCCVVRLGVIDTPGRAVEAGRQLAERHVHAAALAPACWYEDYLVLDLIEECHVPVLLWSLPGMQTGALCGSQQLTVYLKQLDVVYESVFGDIRPGPHQDRAMAFLKAAALYYELRRARIGIVGHRVGGMTETSANEIALKKAIGPRVVPLDLPQLLHKADNMSDDAARSLWRQTQSRVAKCMISDADGLDSMKVYLAIKEQVEKEQLDALTIGCYPHLMGRVCLAGSLLADEGIPMACEGDVNGAVGQLILSKLTGQPTHSTDWLDPLEDGSVVFTHCGSGSFHLAEHPDAITLAPVRLMDQGVCALFTSRPGAVTLLNLIPSDSGYQCAMLEGQAISTEMVFPGNPLRVRFEIPVEDLIRWIHREGIGHHWPGGYGHVAQVIRHWSAMASENLCLIEPK